VSAVGADFSGSGRFIRPAATVHAVLPDQENHEAKPEAGRLARAITAGTLTLAGAGAALSAGGGAGVAAVLGAGAAFLTPYVEPYAALVGAELHGKPQLLADATLAGARSVDPEMAEEGLADALIEDDDLRALMFRVLDAARRTAREDKLRALGSILGRAAADTQRLEEGLLMVAALDDLEGPQILTLRVVAGPAPVEPPTRRGWLDSEIEERTGLSAGAVLASLGMLTRHGLAHGLAGFGGGSSYRATEFGQAVLAAVGVYDQGGSGA
jgi:hypothetical protein